MKVSGLSADLWLCLFVCWQSSNSLISGHFKANCRSKDVKVSERKPFFQLGTSMWLMEILSLMFVRLAVQESKLWCLYACIFTSLTKQFAFNTLLVLWRVMCSYSGCWDFRGQCALWCKVKQSSACFFCSFVNDFILSLCIHINIGGFVGPCGLPVSPLHTYTAHKCWGLVIKLSINLSPVKTVDFQCVNIASHTDIECCWLQWSQ